jgi:pimeloyl-ACP methyl ester carboxylesterase
MPAAQLVERGGAERAFHPAAITPAFERAALRLSLRPESLLANAAERRVLKPALRAQSAHYAEIAVPLVIVAGLGDVVTHADFHSERLHAAVAGSAFVTVPGAGHLICFSHPEPVLRALDDLLARVPSAR